MIYQLAVILTDTEYKCESCVLSPGQDVSNKFMEIDRAISTQKTLGNGDNLNDNTINNPVDLLTPANNANIESGGTGPPLVTDVDQQASVPNADPPNVLLRFRNRVFHNSNRGTNVMSNNNLQILGFSIRSVLGIMTTEIPLRYPTNNNKGINNNILVMGHLTNSNVFLPNVMFNNNLLILDHLIGNMLGIITTGTPPTHWKRD